MKEWLQSKEDDGSVWWRKQLSEPMAASAGEGVAVGMVVAFSPSDTDSVSGEVYEPYYSWSIGVGHDLHEHILFDDQHELAGGHVDTLEDAQRECDAAAARLVRMLAG